LSSPDLEGLLNEVAKLDQDPYSGRLFTYVYETGDKRIREVANRALLKFYDRNALDFTVFKSAVYFERELVKFARELLHGDEDVLGTYSYGGTESIMLAVKAARDYFRKVRGMQVVPELVIPSSAHPSFEKAAEYMGLRVRKVPISAVDKKADTEKLKEAVGDSTALVAASAPNFPYGTIDPIKDIADFLKDKHTLFHVDACVGGYILPFFEMSGERVDAFDFRAEGVTSMSLDAHKYGYAPKGSSLLLFRNPELKKECTYVNVSWPSYTFVNTTLLSSRSVGPMAAAWAVQSYLGKAGYLRLAGQVLSARNRIRDGLGGLGFKPTAPVESSILSLCNEEADLLVFVLAMKMKGWHFELQRRIEGLVPYNIHMTITPVHDAVAQSFVEDSQESLKSPAPRQVAETVRKLSEGRLEELLYLVKRGEVDSASIVKMLEAIPEETARELAKEIVNGMFK